MARVGFLIAALLAAPLRARAETAIVCGADEAMLASLAKTAAGAAVSSTSGSLKILVLRMGFKDRSYSGDTGSMRATNARVAQFYQDNSCGSLNLSFRFYPSVLHAPDSGAAYVRDWSAFEGYVAWKLNDLGLVKGKDYDRYVVNFPSLALGWVGLSTGPTVGGNYINGDYGSATVAHELGHAVGLPHATGIEAGKHTVGSGNDSERVEYGDAFDVMGSGGITGHFNTLFKRRLGWIPDDVMKEVSGSGVFRVYAHDNPEKIGKLLALHIPCGNPAYSYWVEYRTSYASEYVNTRHSAEVRMQGYFSSSRSALLDMTPESRDPQYDFNDANLEIGKSFQDPWGRFSLKTVAVNEGVWNEHGWVDVQVTWGSSSAAGLAPLAIRPASPLSPATLVADGCGRLTLFGGASSGVLFPASLSVPSARPALRLK